MRPVLRDEAGIAGTETGHDKARRGVDRCGLISPIYTTVKYLEDLSVVTRPDRAVQKR
jgi:hypothetical protein